MKHLINIENLTTDEINQIYSRASEFEKGIRKSNHSNAHCVNMFFENSTRTKLSFEILKRLIFINYRRSTVKSLGNAVFIFIESRGCIMKIGIVGLGLIGGSLARA